MDIERAAWVLSEGDRDSMGKILRLQPFADDRIDGAQRRDESRALMVQRCAEAAQRARNEALRLHFASEGSFCSRPFRQYLFGPQRVLGEDGAALLLVLGCVGPRTVNSFCLVHQANIKKARLPDFSPPEQYGLHKGLGQRPLVSRHGDGYPGLPSDSVSFTQDDLQDGAVDRIVRAIHQDGANLRTSLAE